MANGQSGFIALLRHPFLSKGDAEFGREGADDVGRSPLPVGRPANRLAIHGHLPGGAAAGTIWPTPRRKKASKCLGSRARNSR